MRYFNVALEAIQLIGLLREAAGNLPRIPGVPGLPPPQPPGPSDDRADARQDRELEDREQDRLITAALEEYRQLRSDLRMRVLLQNAIFGGAIIVLAVASWYAVTSGPAGRLRPELTPLVFSLGAPLLGLLWIHNRLGAVEVRSYLAAKLAPFLQHRLATGQLFAFDTATTGGGAGADYHGGIWLAFLLPSMVFLGLTAEAALVISPRGDPNYEYGVLILWLLGVVLTLVLFIQYVRSIRRLRA